MTQPAPTISERFGTESSIQILSTNSPSRKRLGRFWWEITSVILQEPSNLKSRLTITRLANPRVYFIISTEIIIIIIILRDTTRCVNLKKVQKLTRLNTPPKKKKKNKKKKKKKIKK